MANIGFIKVERQPQTREGVSTKIVDSEQVSQLVKEASKLILSITEIMFRLKTLSDERKKLLMDLLVFWARRKNMFNYIFCFLRAPFCAFFLKIHLMNFLINFHDLSKLWASRAFAEWHLHKIHFTCYSKTREHRHPGGKSQM